MDVMVKNRRMYADSVGTVRAIHRHIELCTGLKPSNQRPYRVGPKRRATIDSRLQTRLVARVIDTAQSEWDIPVLHDPKKRYQVYFQGLDASTIPNMHPLPQIKDCISRLGDYFAFSALDAFLN